MKTCEHYYCRCARANELAAISDRTGEVDYLVQAIAVHSQRVTCRIPADPPAPQSLAICDVCGPLAGGLHTSIGCQLVGWVGGL